MCVWCASSRVYGVCMMRILSCVVHVRAAQLVGPDAPSGPRRAFLEELNTGKGCEEPADFFHVAIDLPGFGNTKASTQRQRKVVSAPAGSGGGSGGEAEHQLLTSELLNDVIKSLGKHYAYAIVASSEGAAAVLHALAERPNLCSFLCLREPKMATSAAATEGLHSLFQPTFLAYEPRGPQLGVAEAMEHALMAINIQEFSRKLSPKYAERDWAKDILAFLRTRRWRGHLSGFGHSKMRPLLTRLVGGMRMWRGEREYREQQQQAQLSEVKA